MARHVLEAGYPLVVFNRTESRVRTLVELGAEAAKSPAEVASKTRIIIVIVSDTPDVEAVVAGPGGVLEGVKKGSVVVDMSTVSPEAERRLDGALRAKGAGLVDAPVSGGDVGARNATLAIMVGGETVDVERARPVLQTMGKSITHCGPVGSGQLVKLCNQILVSVTLLGVSEAILFARKNGLDPMVMIEAVKGGAAGSWQLSNLGPKIVQHDFAPGFMIDLVQKDLRLVLEAAAAVHAPLAGTSLVRQLFTASQATGDGRAGTQALARIVESLGGLP